MKRRSFFLGLVTTAAMAGYVLRKHNGHPETVDEVSPLHSPADVGIDNIDLQLKKVQDFNTDFSDDVFISKDKYPVLVSLRDKLRAIQSHIGYANYSILSFPDLIKFSSYNPKIGEFNQAQLDLIDELFHENAQAYGFYGERINYRIDEKVDENKLTKISGTGQYVFRGKSVELLRKMQNDIGPELILTSGVRNIAKQLYLFTNKAVVVSGNLSRASRSLAPPGHSFHAIGDFDVGMKGLGRMNFSKEFANTQVYQKIHKLGYINIRYDEANHFGVRYEPWHIKVV